MIQRDASPLATPRQASPGNHRFTEHECPLCEKGAGKRVNKVAIELSTDRLREIEQELLTMLQVSFICVNLPSALC